ncbi:lytic transglycosylase domain-containing protein [Salibacterium sp. K-3]
MKPLTIDALLHTLGRMNAMPGANGRSPAVSSFLTPFQTYLEQAMTSSGTSAVGTPSEPGDSLFLNAGQSAHYFASPEPPVSSSTYAAEEKLSSSGDYTSAIQTNAEKYGVDPDLIRAVIEQESDFNPEARSHAGAMGLMQLMPGTANYLNVKDPYNPAENIEGGTKYLKQMLDKYDGDTTMALAAYNAGPGNVDRYDGIPPFSETQSYVPSVLNNYNRMT